MPRQMKASLIDTNVILRYLMGDSEEQSPKATLLMTRVETGKEAVELSEAVLTEVVWTLESFFKVPRGEISQKLQAMLAFRGLRFSGKAVAKAALSLFATTKSDWVDCLLAARSKSGNIFIYTFDKSDFSKLNVNWNFPQ